MSTINLFVMASMPILKVLLITAIGSFLALDRVDILGNDARKHLNKVVFFVFGPALIASNLAKAVTFETFLTLWFMPINIFITYLIGSLLGWILAKVTKVPKHFKGLIIGSCSAGSLGKLPIIIVPAMCNEKGSPFGAVDVCHSYAMAYASLSMALNGIFIWGYTYNVIRISSREIVDEVDQTSPNREPLLPSSQNNQSSLSSKVQQFLTKFPRNINVKAFLAPSTIGVIIGFMIGMISPLRNLLIGNDAPLHVVQDAAYMLGDATIPAITLILGANLLPGLKGSQIQIRTIICIAVVRYILLPLLGLVIVRGAVHVGILHIDPLFQFILLLQYALPPAMSISTMTQVFGSGQSEYSVILLWTYGLAAVSLTLWSTFFLWLVVS
ncbi:protein PIN-LIKES 3-like isoform X1 [Chenopodium quinoa]|uniref:protein PIN-LIKES 3-like isoform X1 n=1 Tax=Chenopodium quinoa TaxID=63459 RepID=UPI000B794B92|nr:protein PIN-LIKES 3-like isoform X1 [Chenopodium quinoa]